MIINKTRIKFLGYIQNPQGKWRYVHLEEGRNAEVGAIYDSEKALLADLESYASTWGSIDPGSDCKLDKGEVLVRTTSAAGFDVKWSILLNLSDRWGELVDSSVENPEYVAAQDVLRNDPSLVEQLHSMMREEVTFIAMKDGQFGIHLELEFESAESAGVAGNETDEHLPEAQMFDRLARFAGTLEEQFPGQQFVVPEPAVVIHGRPALWAFIPLGAASPERLDAIVRAVLDYAYPGTSEA